MEPASTIIKRLGGATKVASITGVHRTRVYGWAKPKDLGGTGGVIPYPHVGKLIAAAADTATAGGFTVPTELANQIIKSMAAWGPMYDEDTGSWWLDDQYHR